MGASWLALMMLGTPAHAQQPDAAAHSPDRAAPTPSAPIPARTGDQAAMPFAPVGQTAAGVARTRPDAPAASAASPAPAPSGSPAPATPSRADVAVLAAGCANCHGPQGHPAGAIPPLAGLPSDYLRQRLKAFRQGKAAANATVMPRLLASYDDATLDALAQWFAGQDPAGAANRRPAPVSTTSPGDKTASRPDGKADAGHVPAPSDSPARGAP